MEKKRPFLHFSLYSIGVFSYFVWASILYSDVITTSSTAYPKYAIVYCSLYLETLQVNISCKAKKLCRDFVVYVVVGIAF